MNRLDPITFEHRRRVNKNLPYVLELGYGTRLILDTVAHDQVESSVNDPLKQDLINLMRNYIKLRFRHGLLG